MGFLSETADLAADDGGSLEFGDADLEEVYTIIQSGAAVSPENLAALQQEQQQQEWSEDDEDAAQPRCEDGPQAAEAAAAAMAAVEVSS